MRARRNMGDAVKMQQLTAVGALQRADPGHFASAVLDGVAGAFGELQIGELGLIGRGGEHVQQLRFDELHVEMEPAAQVFIAAACQVVGGVGACPVVNSNRRCAAHTATRTFCQRDAACKILCLRCDHASACSAPARATRRADGSVRSRQPWPRYRTVRRWSRAGAAPRSDICCSGGERYVILRTSYYYREQQCLADG